MRIGGKVAKLLSGETYLGSAWLISPMHALTAAHCVKEADGECKLDLTLNFDGEDAPVPVEVNGAETGLLEDWDVAVLSVKASDSAQELSDLVIPLSGQQYRRGDQCYTHGYPQKDLEESPKGIMVCFQIVDPAHSLAFNKQNPVRVVHLAFASTSKNLQGLSGAPVFYESGDEGCAIGIISKHRNDDNSNIYAIPILEIRQLSQTIRNALNLSHNVRQAQKTLCLQVTKQHEVSWSAPILPSEAHVLWSSESLVEQVSCQARLSQMEPADRAFLRLINHAYLTKLGSPDYDDCCIRLNKSRADAGVEGAPAYPERSQAVDHESTLELPQSGSVEITLSNEAMAEVLHETMDAHTLEKLNEQFYKCLNNGNMGERDLEIEAELRNTMWETWKSWYSNLKSEKNLLRQILVRTLSASGHERADSEALIRIGRLSNEHLFLATLFCLALAASDVPLVLRSSGAGNFTLGEENGHVCGLKKFKGRGLQHRIGEHQWTTRYVILPHLNELYSVLLDSMKRYSPNRTPRLDAPGPTPVMITGDSGFFQALRSGAKYVRKYFDARRDEVSIKPNHLSARIEQEI